MMFKRSNKNTRKLVSFVTTIHYIRQRCLLLIFFIILGVQSNSVHAQQLESKIDSLLLDVFKDKGGPGGVFLVAKAGKVVYQKAFGKSNIELDDDLSPENVFQLGSITKQFTAMAILMLEEQGRLSVQDPISLFIPDYPSGDKITVHHLLTHTSGIQDFTKMKSLRDIAQKDLSPKELVDFFKNEPADFAPGERFEYNNSGYVLLGHLIEILSGKSYEQYINENIFEKAGMGHSRYASEKAIISKRAYGYQKNEHGYVNKTRISFTIPFSSGSLMSTVGDMLTWQNTLTNNLLLDSKTQEKAFTKYKLNNGEEFTYGYGWHIREINGTVVRAHGGSIFGFKTMGVYLPSEDIYVIGMSNCECNSPTQVTEDIALMTMNEFKEP